ncbi:hypothetical protein ACAG26_00725 [Mycobacterium sp. pUA109]|uniref:hypothetical protein n=1 Tax=Mycobacterium sp. pUA109 TaxID=3238982 RepID=UPI00351BE317
MGRPVVVARAVAAVRFRVGPRAVAAPAAAGARFRVARPAVAVPAVVAARFRVGRPVAVVPVAAAVRSPVARPAGAGPAAGAAAFPVWGAAAGRDRPMRRRLTDRTRPRMRVPERASDAETALLRYLMYGILPAWFIPGLLDWNQHRRSRIEHTAGTRESLIHLLMMTEVGVPITLALLCEINPLLLTIILGAIAAHEATALWDVTAAEHSGRRVTVWEQHMHSFLEAMPMMAASALGCLRWRQVRRLLTGARSRDAWRLRLKKEPLPAGYLATIGAGVVAAIAVPYGEELLRCLRAPKGN